jgi:hypothetical protein
MATLADPARITAAMAELLGTALRLESLAIVVRDRERDTFLPGFTRHVDPAAGWPVEPLTTASALVRELRENPGALLAEELAHRVPSRAVAAVAGELRGALTRRCRCGARAS